MSEKHIRSITLFFYYLFLEKQITLKATKKTLKRHRKSLQNTQKAQKEQSRHPLQNTCSLALMISDCLHIWRKYQKHSFHKKHRHSKTFYHCDGKDGFLSPVDLAPWCDFLREAEEQVIFVMIFSQILLFPDKDIARGMGISEGTVRYRLGHGLRLLGSMAPNGVTRL